MPRGIPNTTSIATIKDLVPDSETKFKWFTNPEKVHKSTNSTADVSIRLGIKARDKKTGQISKQQYCFTLRNDTGKKFKYQFVDAAALENRLYFKPSPTGQFKIKSYLVKDKTKCNANFGILKTDETKCLDIFIGDHDLKYDKIYELYYIEVDESLVK